MATVLPTSATNAAQPLTLTDAQQARLARLGVAINQYPAITQRETYKAIFSRKSRDLTWPITKTMAAVHTGQVPAPVMLTHIVTTRCNYLCSFCSFADSLNAKTDDLSLSEIEQVYATIGNNINTIVYSGGETTLNKELPDIIEAAYRLTPVKSVYIISNAWKPQLLFEITHRLMQRCPDLHLTWSLSIEGPKEFNNTERRTHADGWDAWQNTIDTLEGMKLMRQRYGYNQLDVQLCTVCTPDNHELLGAWYGMVRDDLQPDKWNLNLMRKSVQMADHTMASFEDRRKESGLEPFEKTYLRITQQVRDDVLDGRLKFIYHTGSPMEGAMKSAVDLLSQEANRNTVTQKPQLFGCKAATAGGFIGSTGDVSGCEEFAHNPVNNKSFGNLRDVGYDFMALWRGNKANDYRKLVGNSTECQGCTLESQRNYPAILVSPQSLTKAAWQGWQLLQAAGSNSTN